MRQYEVVQTDASKQMRAAIRVRRVTRDDTERCVTTSAFEFSSCRAHAKMHEERYRWMRVARGVAARAGILGSFRVIRSDRSSRKACPLF